VDEKKLLSHVPAQLLFNMKREEHLNLREIGTAKLKAAQN